MPNPLKPGPVTPMDQPPQEPDTPQDTRSFWLRLLQSIRPTASVETDKKTGKKIGTVGFKAGTDFCLIACALLAFGGCAAGTTATTTVHHESAEDGP